MFALQCRGPGEMDWTDIYYDARSETEDAARKRLNGRQEFIERMRVMHPETEFQVVQKI